MLDAAVQVFSRQGFHPASMDEISEVAGVSKPMIYTYLGSKDDLFTACIRREAGRLMDLVAEAVLPTRDPADQLYRGLLAFFQFIRANPDGWVVLYRQARVQTFADEVASLREQMILVVSQLLTRRDSDAMRVTPLAYALVGAAEALADWSVEHADEAPAELAARMMDFCWNGLRALSRGEHWTPPGS